MEKVAVHAANYLYTIAYAIQDIKFHCNIWCYDVNNQIESFIYQIDYKNNHIE